MFKTYAQREEERNEDFRRRALHEWLESHDENMDMTISEWGETYTHSPYPGASSLRTRLHITIYWRTAKCAS